MTRNIAREQKRGIAETRFVRVAFDALPNAAMKALLEIAPANIPRWAAEWRVAAPAMLTWAREFRQLAERCKPSERKRLVSRNLSFGRNFWAPSPPEWQQELAALNRLVGLPQTVSDKVVTDYEPIYRRPLVDDEPLPTIGRGEARIVADPDILAPMSADPATETLEHFKQRAADHYEGRRLRFEHLARHQGFTTHPTRGTPQIDDHVEWLVEYQIRKTSVKSIAERAAPNGVPQPQTVWKAIRELATLIELPLRTARRGRPPKREK
jgi:hypothetical protein